MYFISCIGISNLHITNLRKSVETVTTMAHHLLIIQKFLVMLNLVNELLFFYKPFSTRQAICLAKQVFINDSPWPVVETAQLVLSA